MAKFNNKITMIRNRDIKIDHLPNNSKPAEITQQVKPRSKEKSKKWTKKDKVKYEKARIKAKHKLQKSKAIDKSSSKVKSISTETSKKDIKELIIDEFTGTRVTKSGDTKVHSLNQILNNVELLESYMNNLLVKYPEYSDDAKKLIDDAKSKSSYNLEYRSKELNNLVNEISKNKNRVFDMNNIRYSSYNNRMSYTLYANAIYEAFKDDAIKRGVDLNSFRYCLNSMLSSEPWEMYEEEIKFSGSTASSNRTRRFKSPQAIFDEVISKCGDIVGISKLKGFM